MCCSPFVLQQLFTTGNPGRDQLQYVATIDFSLSMWQPESLSNPCVIFVFKAFLKAIMTMKNGDNELTSTRVCRNIDNEVTRFVVLFVCVFFNHIRQLRIF